MQDILTHRNRDLDSMKSIHSEHCLLQAQLVMEKDELSASNSTKNGMANFNNTDSSLDEANSNNDKDLEVNGGDYSHEFDGNDDSSESDALVIDESVNTRAAKHKRRKIKLKVVKKGKSLNNNSKVAVDSDINNTSGENSDVNNSDSKINNEINSDSNRSEVNVKNDKSNDGALLSDSSVRVNNNVTEREGDKEAEPHSNPFFHESLFDLSQKTSSSSSSKKSSTKKQTKRKDGVTQFLGMQPSVQFKCSKCGQNGFESLSLLQQHIDECNESVSVVNRDSTNLNNANGFKLTRKVFLCSACGTYYESWNLYMHMLEFHRRYICLYCLGMFSVLQDLCQHIQNRHNIEPGVKNTPDEFFRTYNEPCYLSCCECSKLFSEQDDFFYHQCSNSGGSKKRSKVAAAVIDPDSHVTGESLITPAANRDVNAEKDDEKANEDKDTEM